MSETHDDFTSKLYGTFDTVTISEIDTDSNAHRDIDQSHISELVRSIREHGLINPITLYRPPGRRRYTIVAGRHRLHALKALRREVTSARVYDYELTEYQLRAIELYENVHRKDLTQVQKEQQIARLHQLLQRVNGPATGGTGSAGHRLADTARLVGRSVGSVAGAVKLDRAIRDLPQLGLDKYEKTSDALRALRRFATAVNNQHVAEVALAGNVNTSLTDKYVLGDFFDNTLESGAFSVIECDPDYGIDIAHMRRTQSTQQIVSDYVDIPEDAFPEFIQRVCTECYRLASPNSWLILWFAMMNYEVCANALRSAGFEFSRVPAIWKKGNDPGQSQDPSYMLCSSYETFFWARKGSPKLHVQGRTNIFDFPRVPAPQKIHPTEKPVGLVREILNTFAWPGQAVLSPFLGSGNTLLAAQQLEMPCVGFELSNVYRNAFVAREARGGGQ